MIAYEEKRKATLDLKAFQMMNKNLESIIESHRQEEQRLTSELKRFTKGKIRSNVLEAELHRKEKQNAIVKRANEASSKIFAGVDAVKATQTNLVGIKGHIIQLTEKEYQEKFCKKWQDQSSQTLIDQSETHLRIDENSMGSGSRNAYTNHLSVQNSNLMSQNQRREKFTKTTHPSKPTTAARQESAAQKRKDSKKSKREKVDKTTDDLYKVTGNTQRTNTQQDEQSIMSRNDSSQGQRSKRDLLNSQTGQHKKSVSNVGVMCNILSSKDGGSSPSGTGRRSQNPRHTKGGNTDQNRLSDSNISGDGHHSMTGLNPLFSQRAEKEKSALSKKQTKMGILKESHEDDDVVLDLRVNSSHKQAPGALEDGDAEEMDNSGKKKRNLANRKKPAAQSSSQSLQQNKD